jgi:hypothetical protein
MRDVGGQFGSIWLWLAVPDRIWPVPHMGSHGSLLSALLAASLAKLAMEDST